MDIDRLILLEKVSKYGWINQWKPTPHPEEEWKELAEWHGKANHRNMPFPDGHVKFSKYILNLALRSSIIKTYIILRIQQGKCCIQLLYKKHFMLYTPYCEEGYCP